MMKGRFWLLLWLLQIPTVLLSADERLHALGQIPPPVARGKLLPISRLASTNELRLALTLPLRDPAGLTHLLASIYSPGSPQYHHYLTPVEFTERFGPTWADYTAITQFARTNGLAVTATHRNRLVLDVIGRAADVERAFHVKLHWYPHPSEHRTFFAPDAEPTVDARLPLLHVSGLNDFYSRHPNLLLTRGATPARNPAAGGSSPLGNFMGNDFRRAYVPGTALTGLGQSVDLVEFDAFRPEDITNYANVIGLTNNVPPVTVMPVAGGFGAPGRNVTEVSLDIEMVLAMSPGVSNIYVYEAPNSIPPVPWVDVMSQIANDDLAAQVSCSWSGGDPDPGAELVFQQMAAQGQSVFNASGDAGADTNSIPFPCASPNITQVGGTYLDTDTNGNYVAEAVWNDGDGVAGGGGVGLAVEMPVWQMGVDMTTNGGSTVWRDVPDVALTAADVYVVVDDQEGTAAGTSCAAPLWAALTALINQQAAQQGQPSVGFINPALYALCRGSNYSAILHDITLGNNTNLLNSTNFYALPGFDLCTGWGTPSGTNLINALTTPDPLGITPQTNFGTSGMVGGPFTETNWVITLTNEGAGYVHWSLADNLPAWLSVSPTKGLIGAYGSTNVAMQLVNASGLPAGGYRAALTFTNVGLSRMQNLLVRLEIGQSIVQNGGFESGDFSDWTLVGDTVTYHSVCNIVGTDADYPGLVHSGNFGALLGQSGYAASLSQVLPTQPGQLYLVSFWLDNLIAEGSQQFSAVWSGTNLVTLTDPASFTWSNFVYVVSADDTNATLEFDAENDLNYFGFDDVMVTPFPPVAFSSYSVATNGFQMTWPSLAGLDYTVQFTGDLTLGSWTDIGDVLAVTNLSTFVDPNCSPSSPQGFYRLMLSP